MANSRYVRLDLDWRDDPKTMLLEERHGRGSLADWVSVMCLMAEFGGSFSMDDTGTVLRVRKALGKSAALCQKMFGQLAECGLIDPEAWQRSKLVTSRRAMADAERVAKRRRYAADASAAAAAKRREGAAGECREGSDGTP